MPTNRMDSVELTSSVALLIVDAQDAFIDSLANREAFRERCAFAIEAARTLNILTIFTEQVPSKLGPTHSDLLKRASNPKVFHKSCFSALSAPGIEDYLRNNEIYHLLVCGLETPICIYQTGLQAVDEDIDVTFLADALGCRRTEDADYALHALRGMGCQTLPSETVFYSLLRDASHPRFKAFSDLVKIFSSPDFSLEAHLKRPLPTDDTKDGKGPPQSNRKRRSRSPTRTSPTSDSKPSRGTSKTREKTPSKTSQPKSPAELPKKTAPQRSSAKKGAKPKANPQSPESSPKNRGKKNPRKRAAKKTAQRSPSNSSGGGRSPSAQK